MNRERIQLPGVTPRRPHRTLDERIFVRFPALARRALRLVRRLPRRSRLRRRLIVRVAVQAACAANRRDFDFLFLGFDPDISYRAAANPDRAIAPDLAGVHHGHAGYREVWRAMLEGFDDLTLTPLALLDLGDRLISDTRLSGHGSGSGAPFEQLIFQVFTFRDGVVTKQEDFWDRGEALAAAAAPYSRSPAA